LILKIAQTKKAHDPRVLKISQLSDLTDYFVILTSESDRQSRAICDELVRELKIKKLKPFGIEGYKDSKWILVDYSDIIIHIFTKLTRDFYELERLWIDATQIDINKYLKKQKKTKKL
jgi:ribosome-associated protein